MAHLRRSGFRTSSVARRKTSWGFGSQTGVDGDTQAIVASSVVLATIGALTNVDGITAVRIRGDLNVFLTLAAALGDGFHGAFGIGTANENAFTAGIASLNTPITDETWDGWMYHRYFGPFSGGPIVAATAAMQEVAVNATSAALHIEVDSKAMRKLRQGMVIYAALEVIEVGAAAQMEWAFNSRVLAKLP